MSAFVFLFALVILVCLCKVAPELFDDHKDCPFWASIGECQKNPQYMQVHCGKSCDELLGEHEAPPQDDMVNSFYEITGESDIEGNDVNFDSFKGKVVLVVNVASYCGYTVENYALFRKLASYIPRGLEIVLAPCNQFGYQEPGDGIAISAFAARQKFEGTILSKADVNGEKTRPIFKFLKQAAGQFSQDIPWNFAGKYLIDRKGQVSIPSDDVETDVIALLNEKEL